MGEKKETAQQSDELILATAVKANQQAIIALQNNDKQLRADMQNLRDTEAAHAEEMKSGLLELSGQIGNAIHETDLRIITKAREDQQRIDYRQYAKWALPLGIIGIVGTISLVINILGWLHIV